MKRLWIGVGILAALVVAGVWMTERMEDVHKDIAAELEQAAEVLQQEDWLRADALMDSARSNWEHHWNFSASVADHTSLDEIDAVFAQLEVYRQHRETTACAAACARLSRQISALEEANRLNWWNLL